MNNPAKNEDEGLGRFRLFFLSAIRTCPLLGESWRVNWRDEGKWTGVVSVDLFESVINFAFERLRKGAMPIYFVSVGISLSDSVTLRKTTVFLILYSV